VLTTRDTETGSASWRTTENHIYQPICRAPTGTRTQTVRILSPLPLPIGLWGRQVPDLPNALQGTRPRRRGGAIGYAGRSATRLGDTVSAGRG
jgi:hypothetical protein